LSNFEIRPINSTDAEKVVTFLRQNWGSTRVISRGRMYHPEKLPGFVATIDGKSVGLLTYEISNGECEVVTVNSVSERLGIGSGLLEAVRRVAISAGCKRLWLITTNDNTHALRFYQKRGYRLVALYPNQLEKSRLLKPEIPLVGMDGIPLRDEIELEIAL
jgi:ribosomal protein S18 acetylase RimI-like enzyme